MSVSVRNAKQSWLESDREAGSGGNRATEEGIAAKLPEMNEGGAVGALAEDGQARRAVYASWQELHDAAKAALAAMPCKPTKAAANHG
jgi:hypothetical protein